MKKLLSLIAVISLLAACSPATQQDGQKAEANADTPASGGFASFGEKIEDEGAVQSDALFTSLEGQDSAYVKVSGTIDQVCQAKGCWMTMPVGEESMRITFKDYGFFVPKDASGKNTVVEGIITKQVTDVETLRHFAVDAGKSPEEVEQITEPKVEYTFEAVGVLIADQP